MEIVEFLKACLDEDERIARAAARQRGGGTWKAERDAREILEIVGEQPHPGAYIPVILQPDDDETTVHIAAHDPARVLREIEAKRRIVEQHRPVGYGGVCLSLCHTRAPGQPQTWPCLTLRLLALPYTGREGYRPEWAPTD